MKFWHIFISNIRDAERRRRHSQPEVGNEEPPVGNEENEEKIF